MAKKAELLKQAQELKLEVTTKNTIAEIEAAIKGVPKAEEAPQEDTETKAPVAKAGKRSAKAVKEAEEKEAKEERKTQEEAEASKPKVIIKVRSKLERRGKKYQAAAKLIEKDKTYGTKDALELATKTSIAKFDATVELHVRLGVDPRHADQNIRASLVLPEGTGKVVKVAVFGDAEDIKKAKAAGADIAAGEELLQQLDKGQFDFDVLIATPTVMAKLGKYARVLGPKGLMPSPKSGTVTKDVAKAVKEAKGGKVEYRVDSNGIVHIGVGKVSFGADKLESNATVIFASIKASKPASVKGNYVQSIYVTTSMGPSIKIDTSAI